MDEHQSKRGIRRLLLTLAILVGLIILAAAAVYGIVWRGRNAEAAEAACNSAVELAKAVDPLATGEVAALIVHDTPAPVADLTFVDASGAERRLSEWRGKAVLFNLWATWCAPCRHEMPALDNLQAELGGDDFEVVAVNIDTGGDEKPKAFLRDVEVDTLRYYADHTTGVFRELKKSGKAFGLPTTLLIDREGCEIGHMAGPAQWDSEDAKALIGALVGQGAEGSS
ncbi:thiol:disulfide interchange protein TlpA [Microbaculum marinum]|uniref:TlpA disulfide reductase family protein n=1 Tax=Microbaculum marinum TaxID=1764581 RepID=A0AAW9RPK2_9HYPH